MRRRKYARRKMHNIATGRENGGFLRTYACRRVCLSDIFPNAIAMGKSVLEKVPGGKFVRRNIGCSQNCIKKITGNLFVHILTLLTSGINFDCPVHFSCSSFSLFLSLCLCDRIEYCFQREFRNVQMLLDFSNEINRFL